MAKPIAASLLQKMDRWVGVPVCWLLSVVRHLVPGAANRHPPRKVLIVKFAEQGSTVLAYEALRRAVDMVGPENVYFLAFEENRFILDLLDLIPPGNVITFRRDGFGRLVIGTLRALGRIRRLGVDAAIDMEFFSRISAAVTYLTGATRRVGFHAHFGAGPYRGDLMTHRVPFNPYLHASQTFQVLVDALAADPDALPTLDEPPRRTSLPAFTPRPAEAEEVRAILRAACGGLAPGPLVLLNPNASDLLPLRRWATERYVELARRLLDRFGEITVALTGAPDEAEAVAAVAARVGSPRCVSLAGRTTLRQLLVLYTLSELLVTNDSGPAHFAALTDINVITLFGPETPALFAAPSPRNTPLWAGLACSPCVNAYNNRQSPCRNNLCMQRITVEQVFEHACRAYEGRAGAGPLRIAG